MSIRNKLFAFALAFGFCSSALADGITNPGGGGGGGGGSGTVTSATVATTGGAGNTGVCSSTTVLNCTISTRELTNAQTGAGYTLNATDNGGYVSLSNAGAQTLTIPQAGTTGFLAGFEADVCNIGAGTWTLTPTTSTLTGPQTLVTSQCTRLISDGTNWQQAGYLLNAAALTAGTLPAARLPNPSASTLGGVESLAAVTHNFLTSISTGGVPAQAQPACGDLSNAAASCSTDATNASNISSGTLAAARQAAAPFATGSSTGNTVIGPYAYFVCTAACTVTPPVPVAGYQFCVMNDDNVSGAITLGAIGSSARYENTARTAYGTAGTGTLVSGGAAGDMICIVGRDATHYLSPTYVGVWTAS